MKAAKSLKIAELKDRLSVTLRRVQRGASVIVTDRDRPIAMLVPIGDDEGCTIEPAKRPFSTIRNKRYAKTRLDVDPVAALMVERGDR